MTGQIVSEKTMRTRLLTVGGFCSKRLSRSALAVGHGTVGLQFAIAGAVQFGIFLIASIRQVVPILGY